MNRAVPIYVVLCLLIFSLQGHDARVIGTPNIIRADTKLQSEITPQNEGTLKGFFKLTIKNGSEQESKIVLVKREGDEIELIDLAYNRKVSGEMIQSTNSESAQFRFRDEWENSEAWEGSQLQLHRAKMKRQLSAVLYNPNGRAYQLKVEALLSVWACSNHSNPTHTAESEKQMRELTSKNGCSGWHKLEP